MTTGLILLLCAVPVGVVFLVVRELVISGLARGHFEYTVTDKETGAVLERGDARYRSEAESRAQACADRLGARAVWEKETEDDYDE